MSEAQQAVAGTVQSAVTTAMPQAETVISEKVGALVKDKIAPVLDADGCVRVLNG